MHLALYQPDIPQNTGTLIRLCACLSVPLDIIEPCGFTFTDRQLRRAAMDYADDVTLKRHDSWAHFHSDSTWDATSVATSNTASDTVGRLILATTKGDTDYTAFDFRPGDTILLGQEQSGVPAEVHAAAHARLHIPMRQGARSLNIAVAGAMMLGEALRQTNGFATAHSD